MANLIEQHPLYNRLPVGQPIIFTISNTTVVTTYFNVKFIAEVFISNMPPNTSSSADLVGTFKTTPNNGGVGMFDFSAIVENHVKADNVASDSFYKGSAFSAAPFPPIHIIDGWTLNRHALKWLAIRFRIEGSTTATGIPLILDTQDVSTSTQYEILNGYLKYTDKLDTINDDFGYDMQDFRPAPVVFPSVQDNKFLTNASTTQYANVEDYGTIAVLNPDARIEYIKLTYYNSSDAVISNENVLPYISTTVISNTNNRFLYFGCFPANLQNWSTTFATALTLDLSYYTVQAFNSLDEALTIKYTININCPTLKGYVPIRLCWLNQWGAWDYYTFTMKSSKTLSTKGSTYTQLEGTWNDKRFRLNGYRGGKKAFRVNATEKIKMNTDFVNESESEWFEELINSPEVYSLEGFQSDRINALLNTYVTPVRLITSSYTRKTIANDKLMQYTFEVEKSKTLRTQSI